MELNINDEYIGLSVNGNTNTATIYVGKLYKTYDGQYMFDIDGGGISELLPTFRLHGDSHNNKTILFLYSIDNYNAVLKLCDTRKVTIIKNKTPMDIICELFDINKGVACKVSNKSYDDARKKHDIVIANYYDKNDDTVAVMGSDSINSYYKFAIPINLNTLQEIDIKFWNEVKPI